MLTLAVLGTAALAVLLSACGGGGGGGTPPPAPPPPPTEGALQASAPGELLSYVKDKLRERQQERTRAGAQDLAFVTITPGALGAPGAAVPTGSVAAATTFERSGTTVQESGVDEDDVLKSEGALIVAMNRLPLLEPAKPAARVVVHRRLADGRPEVAGSVQLASDAESSTWYSGLYLAPGAERAAVLGESQIFYTLDFCIGLPGCASASILPYPRVSKPKVALDVVGLANPAAPSVAERWRIDGRLVGSRLIGNSLVLVTQHAPQLAVDAMPWNAPAAERDAQLAKLTAAELLPTISINGGAALPLVTETDCYVEPRNASFGVELTTITTIDLASATLQRRSRCFVGGSEALYMSPQALYLATTRYDVTPPVGNARLIFPNTMSVDIHKFSLAAGTVDYRGSGNVVGHLGWDAQNRSYRFNEHNGDLRVVSFTGSTGWGVIADAGSATAPPPSPATLTILRERASDKTLQPVGSLPNAQRPAALGKPGEQVYAVRFVGDRGYVVTFRRIDPLYVLDLSDPADPRAVGELSIAGFSNYLFPVGQGLLLGVGRDADDRGVVTGVKLALFDVADAARPTQKFSTTIGDASTASGLDSSRHGIDLFARSASLTRVVLPLLGWDARTSQRPFSLQRFEIDAAARSMSAKPPLAATNLPPDQFTDLGEQRTIQIGDQVYHWDSQTLKVYPW